MLVTRQYDTDHSHWPFSKYDSPRKPLSPRMSNTYDDGSSTGQRRGQGQNADRPIAQESDQLKAASHRLIPEGNPLGIHLDGKPLPPGHPTAMAHETSIRPQHLGNTQADNAGSLVRTDSGQSLNSEGTPSQSPLMGQDADGHLRQSQTKSASPSKDSDDDDLDDDLLDGDGEHPQTAAERAAARRKMKRFRLTHQQTRFLMSEFAKQPHPDAAHRERLSREIPGLSPRQVQVWFQNRRAKIKRLNADDRDRMIKMRAVPDDFDNVQALHSPYGAVHGLGTSVTSHNDYSAQPFASTVLRPLIVDMRRTEAGEHVSPTTGLAQGFANVGFSSGASVGNSDMMCPVSPASTDRYPYGAHYRPPMPGNARSMAPLSLFGSQGSLDAAADSGRQNARSIQPLHLRDTMARARSDSSQSPLRSSMSWKGDTIDYSAYATANTSPVSAERTPSLYQPSHMSSTPTGMGQFDTSYPSHSTQSPTHMGYATSGLSPPVQTRLRSATATLPLHLDTRDQYRSPMTEIQSPHPTGLSRTTRTTTTQYSTGSVYATSYSSTPLAAPVEFSVPRTTVPNGSLASGPPSLLDAPVTTPGNYPHSFQAGHEDNALRTPGTAPINSETLTFGHRGGLAALNEQFSLNDAKKRKRSLTLPTGSSSSVVGL